MSNKYLKFLPKPLLDDLVNGRWLPIVGAGLSRNAVLSSKKTMPLWKELAKSLADEIPGFEYDNPIDAISAYCHEFRRPRLIEKLSELLYIGDAQPGDAHRAFCDIPFDIVCTTNFDFLLERAYELVTGLCTPLVDENQLSINLPGSSVALLKLHGDLNHPQRLVATEEDYDAYLKRYPVLATYLANLLITRTPVLIGYSLDDPDFRQLWQIVRERLGKDRRLAYALCIGASPAVLARFERRGVKAINLAKNRDQSGEILSVTFKELNKYWREQTVAESKLIEEEPLRELSIPRGAASRLCYFAIPHSAHHFYLASVFPLVREVGLVPMTADQVISPGGNIFATIDVLVSRASLIVVDTSSKYAVAEARRAIARKTAAKILVVAQDGTSTPFDLSGMEILYRPDLTSANVEKFLDEFLVRLTKTLEEIEPRLAEELHPSLKSEEAKPQLAEERHRLLQSEEYRATVISAITHLETVLRRQLDVVERRDRGFVSVTNIIKIAKRRDLLGKLDVEQVLRWIEIRNQVVHSDTPVDRNMASEIVNGVDEISGTSRQ